MQPACAQYTRARTAGSFAPLAMFTNKNRRGEVLSPHPVHLHVQITQGLRAAARIQSLARWRKEPTFADAVRGSFPLAQAVTKKAAGSSDLPLGIFPGHLEMFCLAFVFCSNEATVFGSVYAPSFCVVQLGHWGVRLGNRFGCSTSPAPLPLIWNTFILLQIHQLLHLLCASSCF